MRLCAFFLVATLLTLPDFATSIPVHAGAAAPESEKIDEQVLRATGTGQRVPVLLLGRTQLLRGPDAFSEFARSNSARRRTELRQEVTGRLKQIASAEQGEILAALGSPAEARQLWIVNAIVAPLSADEIRRAATLDQVIYIYHAQEVPIAPSPAGTVSEVITTERVPFSLRGKKVPWNLRQIKADKVWRKLKVTGDGTIIALLDNGLNYAHHDLRSNIWVNEREVANNGVDDDGNGFVDDYYGYDFVSMKAEVRSFGSQAQHGTWTAGIAAGDGSGGMITGVAPRAKVMSLVQQSIYTTMLAFQYALENGADVFNMSFSIPGLGNLRGVWRLMADHAVSAGAVLVTGAGNFQKTAPIPIQQRTPEDIPSVISVGGVDRNLQVTSFSSFGPVEWASVKFYNDFPMPAGLTKPDLAAFPGADYPVLGLDDTSYIDPNTSIRGNSFSGPHVAGVAALMLSAAPELPAWKVKEILESTATDLGHRGKDNQTGSGLANAYKAVKKAIELARPGSD